jgi:hypothetical protein
MFAAENILTCELGTESPFDICDDLLYLWTDTSNLIVLLLWINIITIKLDNYNNLVITVVFAYLKAAVCANDLVPLFCQQGNGTSLLACVAFCILLCTCNSLRFHPCLSVSLVMTRPKLTAEAWVQTWVILCEIHGIWSGIRNTWSLNFFSFPLLLSFHHCFILIHLYCLRQWQAGTDSKLPYPSCWSWGFNLRLISVLVTEEGRLCHGTVIYILTHTYLISGRKFWFFSNMVLLIASCPLHM